jgi:hypothetical protein
MRRAAVLLAVLPVGMALSAGCQEATRIVVDVTTDVPCNQVRRTTITVAAASARESDLSPCNALTSESGTSRSCPSLAPGAW